MILACTFQGIFMKWSEEETINSAREISNSDCTTQGNIKDLFLPNSLAKTAMWNLKASPTSLSRLSFFFWAACPQRLVLQTSSRWPPLRSAELSCSTAELRHHRRPQGASFPDLQPAEITEAHYFPVQLFHLSLQPFPTQTQNLYKRLSSAFIKSRLQAYFVTLILSLTNRHINSVLYKLFQGSDLSGLTELHTEINSTASAELAQWLLFIII